MTVLSFLNTNYGPQAVSNNISLWLFNLLSVLFKKNYKINKI